MLTKILNEEEVKSFSKLTGIKARKIFISKNKRYYYATIVDLLLKVRISKEIASKFV